MNAVELIRAAISKGNDGPDRVSGFFLRGLPAGEIAQLVADGILTEVRSIDEWTPCATCECEMAARVVQTIGDRIVACCPLDHAGDVELQPGDTRVYVVDVDRLHSERKHDQ